MCILFVYRGDDDGNSDYSLILASNRDQPYSRPAVNAAFWDEDPTVIGGQDMEKGREGGTWLALSTAKSRLGALLNLPGNTKADGKGRGSIVTNYVRSELSTEAYLKTLEPDRELYNDFNLITVEIGKTSSSVYCYSNTDNNWVEGVDPYLAYSNSLVGTPYCKTQAGRDRFQAICEKWGTQDNQQQLLHQLLELMQWQDKHLPDEQMERQCPKWSHHLASVYVHMPIEGYGTRCHTFVLVKKTGEVQFIEHSLQQPIDPDNLKWHTTQLNSNLMSHVGNS